MVSISIICRAAATSTFGFGSIRIAQHAERHVGLRDERLDEVGERSAGILRFVGDRFVAPFAARQAAAGFGVCRRFRPAPLSARPVCGAAFGGSTDRPA